MLSHLETGNPSIINMRNGGIGGLQVPTLWVDGDMGAEQNKFAQQVCCAVPLQSQTRRLVGGSG